MEEDAIPPNPLCSASPHSVPQTSLPPLSSITLSSQDDGNLGKRRRGQTHCFKDQTSEKQSNHVSGGVQKLSEKHQQVHKGEHFNNMVQPSQSTASHFLKANTNLTQQKSDEDAVIVDASCPMKLKDQQNETWKAKSSPTQKVVKQSGIISEQYLDPCEFELDMDEEAKLGTGKDVTSFSAAKGWVIGPLFQSFKSKMASFTDIVMSPVRLFRPSSPLSCDQPEEDSLPESSSDHKETGRFSDVQLQVANGNGTSEVIATTETQTCKGRPRKAARKQPTTRKRTDVGFPEGNSMEEESTRSLAKRRLKMTSRPDTEEDTIRKRRRRTNGERAEKDDVDVALGKGIFTGQQKPNKIDSKVAVIDSAIRPVVDTVLLKGKEGELQVKSGKLNDVMSSTEKGRSSNTCVSSLDYNCVFEEGECGRHGRMPELILACSDFRKSDANHVDSSKNSGKFVKFNKKPLKRKAQKEEISTLAKNNALESCSSYLLKEFVVNLKKPTAMPLVDLTRVSTKESSSVTHETTDETIPSVPASQSLSMATDEATFREKEKEETSTDLIGIITSKQRPGSRTTRKKPMRAPKKRRTRSVTADNKQDDKVDEEASISLWEKQGKANAANASFMDTNSLSKALLRSYSCPEIPSLLHRDTLGCSLLHSPPFSRVHTSHHHHLPLNTAVPNPHKSLKRARRHTVCSVEIEREIAPLCLRKEVYPSRRSACYGAPVQTRSPSGLLSPSVSLSALACQFLSSPLAFLSKKLESRGASSNGSSSSSFCHVFPSSPSALKPSTSPSSSSTQFPFAEFHPRTDSSGATGGSFCSSLSQAPVDGESEARQQSEEEEDEGNTSCSSQEFEDLGMREEKALSDSEIKVISKEGERGKVSCIRIRKALPRPQNNLTPMGLPRPIRLKKKEFTLEEIYTNKNFNQPTEGRLETIFELPLSRRDGSQSSFGQKRLKRFVEFPELGVVRKPKKQLGPPGKNGTGLSRRRRGSYQQSKEDPSVNFQEVDSILCNKLNQLDLWLSLDQENSA